MELRFQTSNLVIIAVVAAIIGLSKGSSAQTSSGMTAKLPFVCATERNVIAKPEFLNFLKVTAPVNFLKGTIEQTPGSDTGSITFSGQNVYAAEMAPSGPTPSVIFQVFAKGLVKKVKKASYMPEQWELKAPSNDKDISVIKAHVDVTDANGEIKMTQTGGPGEKLIYKDFELTLDVNKKDIEWIHQEGESSWLRGGSMLSLWYYLPEKKAFAEYVWLLRCWLLN